MERSVLKMRRHRRGGRHRSSYNSYDNDYDNKVCRDIILSCREYGVDVNGNPLTEEDNNMTDDKFVESNMHLM